MLRNRTLRNILDTSNKNVIMGCLIFFVSFSAVGVFADSPVWRITDGKNVLYLGGTIHVLSDSDYPLPESFYQAYDESESVVLEANLGQLQNPAKLPEFMFKTMYSDGRDLQSVLSPEVYNMLEQYGSSVGLPIALVKNLKPGMVTVMLMTIELKKRGLWGVGVDEHFRVLSISDQKPLSYLEDIGQQIELISSLGEGAEDDFILFNLKEMENLESSMNNLKYAWRVGDLDAIEQLSLENLRQKSPDDFFRLVIQRNNQWLPKIEAMVKSPSTEFVLVGASHLVGQEGLINLLLGKGFIAEPL